MDTTTQRPPRISSVEPSLTDSPRPAQETGSRLDLSGVVQHPWGMTIILPRLSDDAHKAYIEARAAEPARPAKAPKVRRRVDPRKRLPPFRWVGCSMFEMILPGITRKRAPRVTPKRPSQRVVRAHGRSSRARRTKSSSAAVKNSLDPPGEPPPPGPVGSNNDFVDTKAGAP
jgi:hypothetical protein